MKKPKQHAKVTSKKVTTKIDRWKNKITLHMAYVLTITALIVILCLQAQEIDAMPAPLPPRIIIQHEPGCADALNKLELLKHRTSP